MALFTGLLLFAFSIEMIVPKPYKPIEYKLDSTTNATNMTSHILLESAVDIDSPQRKSLPLNGNTFRMSQGVVSSVDRMMPINISSTIDYVNRNQASINLETVIKDVYDTDAVSSASVFIGYAKATNSLNDNVSAIIRRSRLYLEEQKNKTISFHKDQEHLNNMSITKSVSPKQTVKSIGLNKYIKPLDKLSSNESDKDVFIYDKTDSISEINNWYQIVPSNRIANMKNPELPSAGKQRSQNRTNHTSRDKPEYIGEPSIHQPFSTTLDIMGSNYSLGVSSAATDSNNLLEASYVVNEGRRYIEEDARLEVTPLLPPRVPTSIKIVSSVKDNQRQKLNTTYLDISPSEMSSTQNSSGIALADSQHMFKTINTFPNSYSKYVVNNTTYKSIPDNTTIFPSKVSSVSKSEDIQSEASSGGSIDDFKAEMSNANNVSNFFPNFNNLESEKRKVKATSFTIMSSSSLRELERSVLHSQQGNYTTMQSYGTVVVHLKSRNLIIPSQSIGMINSSVDYYPTKINSSKPTISENSLILPTSNTYTEMSRESKVTGIHSKHSSTTDSGTRLETARSKASKIHTTTNYVVKSKNKIEIKVKIAIKSENEITHQISKTPKTTTHEVVSLESSGLCMFLCLQRSIPVPTTCGCYIPSWG